jgi:hypothetical protein
VSKYSLTIEVESSHIDRISVESCKTGQAGAASKRPSGGDYGIRRPEMRDVVVLGSLTGAIVAAREEGDRYEL